MANNEYCLDLAFNLEEDVGPDGLYIPMDWGVAYSYDDGAWSQIASGGSSTGFGVVSLTGSAKGIASGDKITFNVFSQNAEGTEASNLGSFDWVRVCFRPAHDVLPGASNLKTTPLRGDRTDDLLDGIDLTGGTVVANVKSNGIGSTFACAIAGVETLLRGVNGALDLANVPPTNGEYHYEFTAYLQATDGTGTVKWFKTDPELITGNRGGG